MNLTLDDVIALAEKHLGKGDMVSSAELALEDAKQLRDEGTMSLDAAQRRALRSLAFSVGVFHPDYQRANEE